MLKKVLLIVMTVFITGGAIMAYGTYKLLGVTVNEMIRRQEPQFVQYMQMNEADQSKFIIDNSDDILTTVFFMRWTGTDKDDFVLDSNDKFVDIIAEEEATVKLMNDTKDDPAVQKAFVEFGRSCVAKLIMHSDAITNNMDADTKAKYQKESDEINIHFEQYCKVLDAAGANLNAVQ